jgi:hypothetical protein
VPFGTLTCHPFRVASFFNTAEAVVFYFFVMTVQEKISLAAQANKLVIFKEGMFYKLYNQNAMWFVNHIKPYKVSVKFVKKANQNVFTIGFPQTVLSLNKLQINLKPIKEEPNYLCYHKYTLGETLKKESIQLLVQVYKANKSKKENRLNHIDTAREHLEIIRLLFRVTKDLQVIGGKTYVNSNLKIEELSRQLTAWQNYTARANA